jgi:hypothetical protein
VGERAGRPAAAAGWAVGLKWQAGGSAGGGPTLAGARAGPAAAAGWASGRVGRRRRLGGRLG